VHFTELDDSALRQRFPPQEALSPLRGYRRFGLRNLFVVGQMAASLMLLLVTCHVAVAFLHTAGLDPGLSGCRRGRSHGLRSGTPTERDWHPHGARRRQP
jgi:hypothetical protein